jgi:hypothetical protein
LRTTIALATNDSFTARMLADRRGKQDRLKPRFTVTDGGQQAQIAVLLPEAATSRRADKLLRPGWAGKRCPSSTWNSTPSSPDTFRAAAADRVGSAVALLTQAVLAIGIGPA